MVAAHAAGHSVVGGSIRNVRTRRAPGLGRLLLRVQRLHGACGRRCGRRPARNERLLRPGRRLPRSTTCCDEGRWESWLHPRLQERGFELWCDPAIVLDHAKDFGFFEFVSQRYHYSRSYAGMRNAELGRKRAVYALGSPLLVPLAYLRIARNVRTRRALPARVPARNAADPPLHGRLGVRRGDRLRLRRRPQHPQGSLTCGSASTRRAGQTGAASDASPGTAVERLVELDPGTTYVLLLDAASAAAGTCRPRPSGVVVPLDRPASEAASADSSRGSLDLVRLARAARADSTRRIPLSRRCYTYFPVPGPDRRGPSRHDRRGPSGA